MIKYELLRSDRMANKTTVALSIDQFQEIISVMRSGGSGFRANNISTDATIFPITERTVQKYLQKVVDYLGYGDSIGTHSFRKFFATEIYKNNNYDIVLVQKLLQHSSVATTQRYINVEAVVETALQNHVNLL